MDVNKIALVLAIVALILMYPVGVFANLTSPRIRDWYSTRSQKGLRERIVELEQRLERSRSTWTFTPAEEEMYRLSRSALHRDHSVSINIFTLAFMASLYLYPGEIQNLHIVNQKFVYWMFVITTFTCLAASFDSQRMDTSLYNFQTDMHTERGRESLRARIENLKKKQTGQQ
jgi:hypothetical protein